MSARAIWTVTLVGAAAAIVLGGIVALVVHVYRGLEALDRAQKANVARFAAEAPAVAVAAAPDPKRAHLVSINIKYLTACAWVDTGTDDGVMPVHILGLQTEPGKMQYVGGIAPIAHRPVHDRADGFFQRQLNLVLCDGNLPPKPHGVIDDPTSELPLSRLWGKSPERWAVIPSGEGGFLGVSRRENGGDVQTPVFGTAAAVRAWAFNVGNTEADGVNAEGNAIASAAGACITNSEGHSMSSCPDWQSDYTVLH